MCGCERHQDSTKPCTCLCEEHANFKYALRVSNERFDQIANMAVTISKLVEELMLACAQGRKQEMLIYELLEGPVRVSLQRVPGMPHQTRTVGVCKLPWDSWFGLSKRLRRHGFHIVDGDYQIAVVRQAL